MADGTRRSAGGRLGRAGRIQGSGEPADEGSAAHAADQTEAFALAELALCENLSQTSGWAARWSASMTGADAALLWAPDTVHPLFLCIGAHGAGARSDSPPVDSSRRGLRPRHGPRPSRDRARPGRPRRLGRPVRARRARGLSRLRGRAPAGGGNRGRSARPLLRKRSGRRRDARAVRCLPEPRGAGAGPRAAIRAQDGRHAPRDRAADQPVRPLQGIRLDDRHRRALGPGRPQGRRLRDRGGRLALAARRATRARSPRRPPPSTRTTTSRRPAGRRLLGHRGRHRRSGRVPAQSDPARTTRSRRKTRGTR